MFYSLQPHDFVVQNRFSDYRCCRVQMFANSFLVHDVPCYVNSTERENVRRSVLFITTLGKGPSSSCCPLFSTRHSPPTDRMWPTYNVHSTLLLSRQYTAVERVAAAVGSGLNPKWGRVWDFIDWSDEVQGYIGFERSLHLWQ